jgi:hypothetical protein
LAFKFFDLYAVLEKIGKVAYKLDLPATSSVHPVFHVSQLKKAVGSNIQVTDYLPSQVPEKILQLRLIDHGVKSMIQVLVKWSSLPVSLATWEDMEVLRQRFQVLQLGDKPVLQEVKMLGTGYRWREMKAPVLSVKKLKKETLAQWAVVWACVTVCLTGV